MKKFLIFALLITVVRAVEYDDIPLLKWVGPEGSRPETYEEWLANNPVATFSYCLEHIYDNGGREGTVVIITEQSLYTPLSTQLNQLCTNLQYDGYTVQSFTMTGGTAESLKVMLQDLYTNYGIEGVLLIGNLPVAWFEIANDFGSYGYTDFPCDLFFMDLDGTWLDTMTTGNGKYDGHTGAINPEIYVSRLCPQGIGDDTLLLQNYFSKNNSFRYDTLWITQRALVFVDDDWIPWAGWWAENVALLYSDTMNYWDAETTRASVYRQKLDTVQAWVSVFAHSSPQMHQFTFNNGNSHDFYMSGEYMSQDPPVNFYNFFACSFSRFTTSGNCGGSRAIFNQSYGIGSIGSTKTGSMLEFEYFYGPLGQGKNLGQAFKDWFYYITDDGVTFEELCWHYGMTLLADCFLKPVGHNYTVAERTVDQAAEAFLMLGSSVVGERIKANIMLPASGMVSLSLYNATGQRVMQHEYRLSSGVNTIMIGLNDQQGVTLPNGVYLLKVASAERSAVEKIVKLQ